MEQADLTENERELELSKHISLKALDPVQLDMLRYTGRCSFKLPELLFDPERSRTEAARLGWEAQHDRR